MSNDYTKIFENAQNDVPDAINYFLNNNTTSYSDFQQIPIENSYKTIDNSPVYEQNNIENNSFLKPVSYYTYLTNNNTNYSSRGKDNNTVKYYYAYSPRRKNNEVPKVNMLSIFNYDTDEENIVTSQTPINLNTCYDNNNYVTYINDNKNKYRSRSPVIIRKNNYLIKDAEPNVISTNYSRSPNSSQNKRNNNYNIISTYIPESSSTNDNNIIINNNLPSDYYNFNYNNEYEIVYPSSSYNNIKTKVYNAPSSDQNNNTYYTLTPNTKSTDQLLNKIGSQTYQSINLPGNSNNSNCNQYSYVPHIIKVSDFNSTINANGNNNIIYSPSKDNRTQTKYISYPMNNINTIQSTNNYAQLQSHSPNIVNMNSIPSSSEMLISNNCSRNQILPNTTKNDYNSGNNNVNFNNSNQRNNQYGNRNGNFCFKNNNNYSFERQINSPIVSEFDKKNKNKNKIIEEKRKNNFSPSFCREKKSKGNLLKRTKDYANNLSSSNTSRERNKEDIKNSLFSKVKKYINEKLETGSNDDGVSEKGGELEEEISTDINNNNINKVNNSNNKGSKGSSFLNKTNYNIKSNLIKNESLEKEPEDYFSQYMFSHINQIRKNPKNYIPKIKRAMKKISTDKRGRIIYKGRLKVALCKGKEAFEEAISDLKNMEPMEPLIFKKDLCVEISEKEKEFKSGDYLRNKIKEKINNGISVNAFWRDIINDPEINLLLMIVDDNAIRRGYKRKDILGQEMKYIGINSGNLDERFVCYTVLSED